jgi:chromatin segregation and condensation protein Rec8/ScpA/Scc1 (kleisin family)
VADELGAPAEGPYRVKLSDIFEGPMDLLVHLIKKNEINIYDIPIALVTEQYLQYLEWMDAMNVEYAAEFVVMASTLTQIKSRLLLPVHADEEGEEEDPRQALVRSVRCWAKTPLRGRPNPLRWTPPAMSRSSRSGSLS